MNKSNAHLYKPFVDALAVGKDITFRGQIKEHFTFEGDPEDYAIVEPPKKVPLTFEDMEPGCHLRFQNGGDEIAITRIMRSGVKLENDIFCVFEGFMHAEIYRPSTGKWEPAYKLQSDES